MNSSRKLKKYAWVLIKVSLSIIGFWYAFHSVDVIQIKEALKQSNLIFISLAFICYVLSQCLSSLRLRYIMSAIQDDVPVRWNLKLYFQGMAYNLFLPGGIGGDAYKMIAYAKRSSIKAKRYFLPLLADRLLGLAAIIILLAVFTPIIPALKEYTWWNSTWVIPVVVIVIVLGYSVAKKWFKHFTPIYWKGLLYSVGIQVLQLAAILCIYFSMETVLENVVFVTMFVFLLSSIATAVPVFMGGLGAREVVFATLFPAFGLAGETGVWIALVFSTIVVISSLPGLFLGLSKD
ncbi:MAG: uncharacterized membrane protein YbhN (UPF0104 family) [Bacteroidia bacterium]